MSFDCALTMGYSYSKYVGEEIVVHARKKGAHAFSVRIGQISGHSEKAGWKDSEAIPLLIRSGLMLQSLPEMQAVCSWIPVDLVARCLCELAISCRQRLAEIPGRCVDHGGLVYNLVNPHYFEWSTVLDELRSHGFQFETTPLETWIGRLEQTAQSDDRFHASAALIDHYRAYGSQASTMLQVVMDCTLSDSETLGGGEMNIIANGILGRYAKDWRQRWNTGGSADCGTCADGLADRDSKLI